MFLVCASLLCALASVEANSQEQRSEGAALMDYKDPSEKLLTAQTKASLSRTRCDYAPREHLP